MHTLIQAVVLGVLIGGVYALMASGQTLIFGIMRVVNLAQGALVVLAAYLTFTLFTQLGIDPFVSVLITTPLLFGLGMLVQLAFLRPLRHEEAADLSLLVTFAVALGIEGALSFVYLTTYRSIQPGYEDDSWLIAGFRVPVVRFYAFALSVVLIVALVLLLNRTRLGHAIQATAQNPVAARLLGIDTNRIAAVGFGLGAATAAAAGSVYGLVYPFNSGSHYDLIARMLSIVVLGGLGSVGGAVLAAIAMGVVSSVVAVELSPIWGDFTFFVVLLVVLLLRPQGLFGVRLRGAA
ncbi:branched-chain amino acid ABC transporter permease [Flindersiella endophytica]